MVNTTASRVLWLAHSRNRYGYNPLSLNFEHTECCLLIVLVNLGDFNKWQTFRTLFDVLWSTDLDMAGIRFQKFQQTENWFSLQPSCGYIHTEALLTQCLFSTLHFGIKLWPPCMQKGKYLKKTHTKSRPSSFLLRSA